MADAPIPQSTKNTEAKTGFTWILWDLPLRLFHWALVILVTGALLTGYILPEWWLDLHVYGGYGLAALLLFRLVWGFCGSFYSRFRSFPLSIAAALAHLKTLAQGRAETYAGHNPAGAWMILVLLGTLAALVGSGFLIWGGQEGQGPLAGLVGYSTGHLAAEVHEVLAALLLAAIALHLAGVFVETVLLKHPLVSAMVTGKKPGLSAPGAGSSRAPLKGALIFGAVALSLTLWIGANPRQATALPSNQAYQRECADCHPAYHPSLRQAQDWQAIMAGLGDHYGEDASLDPETVRDITAYLIGHDAQTVDTEVANTIGRQVSASHRMTDTPYWQRRHRGLAEAAFQHSAVGSKVNCNACHRDAASGRFDDVEIQLPKGLKP